MFYGRKKVFTLLAIFGFFIGTAAYFIFNWLVTNNLISVTSFSIVEILFSPWFISGIIGAIITTTILAIVAYLSVER